jgi:hypothetical protein
MNVHKTMLKGALILFVIGICVALASCSFPSVGKSEAEIQAEIAQDERSFACMESEGATAFSFFTGSTIRRSVQIPKDSGLSKEEWMEIINKCFMDSNTAALYEILKSTNFQQTE